MFVKKKQQKKNKTKQNKKWWRCNQSSYCHRAAKSGTGAQISATKWTPTSLKWFLAQIQAIVWPKTYHHHRFPFQSDTMHKKTIQKSSFCEQITRQ